MVGSFKQSRDTLYLVACVKTKRPTRAKAKDLYTSDWFVKARAYVEKMGKPWLILSDLYGLVDPEDVIPSYEKTLKDAPLSERYAWARKVLGQLEPHLGGIRHVVFLASRRYREHLAPALRERGMRVTAPMQGLNWGNQLQWLDHQLRS